MTVLFFLLSISLEVGEGCRHFLIGDFNTHIRYLNSRADSLGYEGGISPFPYIQLGIEGALSIPINPGVDFSVRLGNYRLYSEGVFKKNGIEAREEFTIDIIPFSFSLLAHGSFFYFETGLDFLSAKTQIHASCLEEFNKSFPWEDIGIHSRIGLRFPVYKRIGIDLGFSLNYALLKTPKRLWFCKDGYLYYREEGMLDNGRRAILDLTGGGILLSFILNI